MLHQYGMLRWKARKCKSSKEGSLTANKLFMRQLQKKMVAEDIPIDLRVKKPKYLRISSQSALKTWKWGKGQREPAIKNSETI